MTRKTRTVAVAVLSVIASWYVFALIRAEAWGTLLYLAVLMLVCLLVSQLPAVRSLGDDS